MLVCDLMGHWGSQDPNSAPVIANAASTAVAQGAPATAVSKSLAQVLLPFTVKRPRRTLSGEPSPNGMRQVYIQGD